MDKKVKFKIQDRYGSIYHKRKNLISNLLQDGEINLIGDFIEKGVSIISAKKRKTAETKLEH